MLAPTLWPIVPCLCRSVPVPGSLGRGISGPLGGYEPGSDRAPVTSVDGFDGVGASVDPPDFHAWVQTRHELAPGVLPQSGDCRVLPAHVVVPSRRPRTVPCRAGAGLGHFVSVQAGGMAEGVADQVRDAGSAVNLGAFRCFLRAGARVWTGGHGGAT